LIKTKVQPGRLFLPTKAFDGLQKLWVARASSPVFSAKKYVIYAAVRLAPRESRFTNASVRRAAGDSTQLLANAAALRSPPHVHVAMAVPSSGVRSHECCLASRRNDSC